MTDETKISQNSSETDLQFIIKLQKAGNDIFRANSEDEISAALISILKFSPYITAYYEVEDYQLHLVGAAGKLQDEKVTVCSADVVSITPADIAAKFSTGLVFSSLDGDVLLPDELTKPLLESGCTKGAHLPVVDSVETIGLFVFGTNEGNPFSQFILDPFVSLAELLPIAREKVKTNRAIQQRLARNGINRHHQQGNLSGDRPEPSIQYHPPTNQGDDRRRLFHFCIIRCPDKYHSNPLPVRGWKGGYD